MQRLRWMLANGSFTAVHADQVWMAPYALQARRIKRHLRTVLDQHNATFSLLRQLALADPNRVIRLLLKFEASRMRRFESDAVRRFDRVVWVSARDRKHFNGIDLKDCQNTEIPIGIDISPQPVRGEAAPFRATFIGSGNWPPNTQGISWLLREIWPAVHRSDQHLVLTIIGRNPPRALQELARHTPGVEITGYVPDPSQILSQTCVFLVPMLSGSGLRVKILDAWNWGLPVVSTTQGAEGLLTSPGEDILLADTPTDFAGAISRLARDQALAERLSTGGRRKVAAHYSWERLYPAWDLVYREES